MAYFTTNDKTDIYYNDQGSGAPVVLIHGWPLNGDMWEYQTLALLDQGYRVITYDRRGFGRSARSATSYDYDTLAHDLKLLIEHLDLSQATLIGFSMGGGEVARYLGTYGADNISGAVLVSSVVPYLLKTESNPEGVPEAQFDLIIEQLKNDRPKFLAEFNKLFFGIGLISSPVSAEMMQWTTFLAYQASLRATVECVNSFGKTDFRADLKAFTIPTLIIHGTGDKTVPLEPTAQQAAQKITGSRLKTYAGAPHGLFITHAKELNNDLIEFLDETTLASREGPGRNSFI